MTDLSIQHVISWVNREFHINCDDGSREDLPTTKNIIRAAAANKGLEVFVNKKYTYFYNDGMLIGGLIGNRSSTVSAETSKICRQKHQAYKILEGRGIPIPKGKIFKPTEFNEALRWVKEQDRRVVVKPIDFEGGKGVTVNIDEDFFSQAWEHCINILKKSNKEETDVIVEIYCPGVDIRAIVIDGRFICATSRLYAYVIGDGQNDIYKLIEIKNSLRKESPFLKEKLIKVDSYTKEWLDFQGLSLNSTPKQKEVVLLQGVSNLDRGGEPADVTDVICDDLKLLAIRAAQAFPNLDYAGVDIIASNYNSAEGAVVNEINTYNDIRMHYYPVFGNPRDPAGELIEYYLRKYERYKNYPLDDLFTLSNEAIKRKNNSEAIILLQHALTHYEDPPVNIYVTLARLYIEDNCPVKAAELLNEAMSLCSNCEILSIIKDISAINSHGWRRMDELAGKLRKEKRTLRRLDKKLKRFETQNAKIKQQNGKLRVRVKRSEKYRKELYKIKLSRSWRYFQSLKKVINLFRFKKLG